VSTIIYVVLVVHKPDTYDPIVSLLCPVSIGIVLGVSGQSGAHVKEDAVRDGILVVVTDIGERDLPPQPASARLVVPVRGGLGVKHGLCQRQPLGVFLWGIRVLGLGGQHGGHAPETLVVVPERGCPVRRHVAVLRRAGLEDHGIRGHVVVGRVAGEVPVVNHRTPHRASLPPVVVSIRRRARENARRVSRLVSVVVRQELCGHHFCCLLDRSYSQEKSANR
jgi:hypothetical protein